MEEIYLNVKYAKEKKRYHNFKLPLLSIDTSFHILQTGTMNASIVL